MNFVPAPQDEPLVSVVVPTHNRAHKLPRAIRSVLAQTYENLELIVADDASTDMTRELVEGFSDPRVKYVRHERNRGAGAARNLGLAHARGEFIAFQDSDDEWVLDKLKLQLDALKAQGNGYGAIFGGKLIYGRGADGSFQHGLVEYQPHRPHRIVSGWMLPQFIEQNLISPQTLLVKAEVLRKTGPFDERLPNNEDWEFALRLSAKTKIHFLSWPLAVTYASKDSISLNVYSKARSFMLITRKHEKILKRNPRAFGRHLYAAGLFLHRLKRYRSARKYLRRAIGVYPWAYKVWVRLLLAWAKEMLPSRDAPSERTAHGNAPSPAAKRRRFPRPSSTGAGAPVEVSER